MDGLWRSALVFGEGRAGAGGAEYLGCLISGEDKDTSLSLPEQVECVC